MNIKRIMTALIGLPIVFLGLVFGNKYIVDFAMAIVAIMAFYEYDHCVKKEYKVISWMGYALCILIAFLHIIPANLYIGAIIIGIPTMLLLLFSHIVFTNMKINFKDIAMSFIGILYVVGLTVFIPVLYGNSGNSDLLNGKFLIWYLLLSSWGTDIMAYLVGKHFGKHKFSKVSPNKTIEGCVAGTIGAIISCLVYTFILKQFLNVEVYSYITIAIVALVLSIIGQLGDFAASTIKRQFDIKDFSEIFPGHGGMIDRIDSVMFAAPYAYFIFAILLV